MVDWPLYEYYPRGYEYSDIQVWCVWEAKSTATHTRTLFLHITASRLGCPRFFPEQGHQGPYEPTTAVTDQPFAPPYIRATDHMSPATARSAAPAAVFAMLIFRTSLRSVVVVPCSTRTGALYYIV